MKASPLPETSGAAPLTTEWAGPEEYWRMVERAKARNMFVEVEVVGRKKEGRGGQLTGFLLLPTSLEPSNTAETTGKASPNRQRRPLEQPAVSTPLPERFSLRTVNSCLLSCDASCVLFRPRDTSTLTNASLYSSPCRPNRFLTLSPSVFPSSYSYFALPCRPAASTEYARTFRTISRHCYTFPEPLERFSLGSKRADPPFETAFLDSFS